jgi:hypothetical protein
VKAEREVEKRHEGKREKKMMWNLGYLNPSFGVILHYWCNRSSRIAILKEWWWEHVDLMTFQPCGTVVTVSLDHETSQEEESFGSGCGATRQQSHEQSVCVPLCSFKTNKRRSKARRFIFHTKPRGHTTPQRYRKLGLPLLPCSRIDSSEQLFFINEVLSDGDDVHVVGRW